MAQEISLRGLFSRAVRTASKASALLTIEDETQGLTQSAISDLRLLANNIDSLQLFSKNETLDDIATVNLIYLSVAFVRAEVELSARATVQEERAARLRQAQSHFRTFTDYLSAYSIIPAVEKRLYEQKSSIIADPARRREIKIAQYKKEKEIKEKIEALRKKRKLPDVDYSNAYDLVDSLLDPGSREEEIDDDDVDDALREVNVLLLRLQSAQTATHLESIDQELELLRNAPPTEESRPETVLQDDTWKLDLPAQRAGPQQGPLLDSGGRPLRPFTILPSSTAAERSRLAGEVFGPDHRLPTMSIDQYLEEERRRGNIIEGGGAQSAAAPTKKEQLTIDSETDGTSFGEEKSEEKRQEDERWARFTDENPRGSGNTMNRG